MDLSKFTRNDQLALGAGVVVVVTALLSISNEWGAIMVLSLLAGAGVIAVIARPIFAPTVTLPVAKGAAILGLGATALVADGLAARNWIEYIVEHLAKFDTLQFLVGLAAAAVITWVGLTISRFERATVASPAA